VEQPVRWMADDDLPLAALAAKGTLSSRKLDDNTPLATLAKPKTKLPKTDDSTPLSAIAAKTRLSVGKPKAKAAGRRRGSSSSSSSSYTSSSSDAPLRKKKAVAKKKPVNKRASEEGLGDDADNRVKKKVRSNKEDIVGQLLSRWWFSAPYVAEDWPPQDDAFYMRELDKQKMRLVTCEEWECVPELDGEGRRKVYSLSQFKGLFRNSTGDLVDLRPKDTCPSYNNFMKKDLASLCMMLVSAYENQLKELPKSKYNEDQNIRNIKDALTKVRAVAARA